MASIDDTLSVEMERIKKELPKEARKLVKEAGLNADKVIKANTPQSGMSFAQRQKVDDKRKEYYTNSLVSDIIKTRITLDEDFAPKQLIGYGEDNGWRAHFTNSGAVHPKSGKITSKPQYFIEKARGIIITDTQEIFEDGIREVFNRWKK